MNRITFSLLVTMFVARLLAACAPPSPTFQQTSGETPTYTTSSEAARVARLEQYNARLLRRLEALEHGQRRGDSETETVGQALSRRDRGSYAAGNGGSPAMFGGGGPGYVMQAPTPLLVYPWGWLDGGAPWNEGNPLLGGARFGIQFNMDPSQRAFAARILVNGNVLPIVHGFRSTGEPFLPTGQGENREAIPLVPPEQVYGGGRVEILLSRPSSALVVTVEFWECTSFPGTCSFTPQAFHRRCVYRYPEGHAETEISVTVGGIANTCNG